MKRLATVTLAGWVGIAALAWQLADRRIALCNYETSAGCVVRTTAARDNILVWGIGIGFATALMLVAAWVRTGPSLRDFNLRRVSGPAPKISDDTRGSKIVLAAFMLFVFGLGAVLYSRGEISLAGPVVTSVERGVQAAGEARSSDEVVLTPVEGDPFAEKGVAAEATLSEDQ